MDRLLELKGTSLVVRIPVELDHHTAEEIRTEADFLLKTEEVRKLVFDFADTVFCDSSGIGMLMGRYKVMRALGGEVRAIHVGENVYRILRMSGITKLMLIEKA